jgi:hypothetical protein
LNILVVVYEVIDSAHLEKVLMGDPVKS